MDDLNTKTKSFWERPEGTTGMITIGAIGLGVFFAGNFLMGLFATIIALLGQGIAIVALCLVLFAILYLVTNKKVQTLVSYGFKSVMRKITGAFVEIDPIGIMKSYIEDLKGKREIMMGSIEKLMQQIRILKQQIQKNDTGYENAMSAAHVAKEKGIASQIQVNARQAGRLQKLNESSFKPLLAQMEVHLRALNKYHEVTGTVILDLANEVEARKIERDMIMASHTAMSAAKKILMGGTDQKELFDQAMEFVVTDYAEKLGAIESFIENSKGFVEGLDMQNGVYEADALKKLQEWENKADDVLLGTAGKQHILEHSPSLGTGLPAMNQQYDYSQFIKR